MTTSKNRHRGLFVNTSKANCSIYESGLMCYKCLKLDPDYIIEYHEVCEENRSISLHFDFYVFNYHETTMGWLDTKFVKSLPGFKSTIVLEVLPNNPFVMCPKGDFDAYLVLDPTLSINDPAVYTFPRPLEKAEVQNTYVETGIPVIGTFGFATPGKGFDKVIDAVNEEFDKAIIKINIPKGDYVPQEFFDKLVNELNNYPTKDDVKVIITDEFFNKEELIKWCARNTLNVFLYNRTIPGLSATTDQAITSGRPLAISTNPTFRHIHQYIKPYPFQSLKDSISNSQNIVSNIQKDWDPVNFALKFKQLLESQNIGSKELRSETVLLPVKKTNRYISFIKRMKKSDFIPPIVTLVESKIKAKISKQASVNSKLSNLVPFVHYALLSYSRHREDLFLDLLFGKKENGIYIDVGAGDPDYLNNTKRFYLRGWTGINVEPNAKSFKKLSQSREKDININMAIYENEVELPFYSFSDDTTLSTLSYETAKKASESLDLQISTTLIPTIPLSKLLDQNMTSNHIDFISIDVQGTDLIVLQSNNWDKFRPSVVIVNSSTQFIDIRKYMDSKDYLHIFSNDNNAIFVDKHTKDASILSNLNWQQI